MSSDRPLLPGATRQCPHCREVILQSAIRCPACRHYLTFDHGAEAPAPEPAVPPLRIEGSIRHPADGEPWEYTVVVSIHDDRGVEVARKLINVGAISANEQRSFTLTVEAVPAKGRPAGRGGTRH